MQSNSDVKPQLQADLHHSVPKCRQTLQEPSAVTCSLMRAQLWRPALTSTMPAPATAITQTGVPTASQASKPLL